MPCASSWVSSTSRPLLSTPKPDCGNPVRRRLHAPSPTHRWRPSCRRRCSQRRLCTYGREVRFPPCRRSTAAHTRSSPRDRRCSGCRWANGKRRSQLTALSRTGEQLQSSQRSRQQEAGRQLAEFFFSSSTPRSRLGQGSCSGANARVIYEEIRQSNCNAYISCPADLCASLLLALLLNTFHSVYTVVCYFPGLLQW
jgi:hypothetical protein